jgi:hypothetical protein
MLTEQIEFTFILTAYGIADYMPIDIAVNGNIIHSERIVANGRKLVTVSASLSQGPAAISLSVTEKRPGAVRIENVKLAWIADASNLNSTWISLNDNEIWNYNDPGAAAAFDRIVNGAHAKAITLDYATDESVPSYLRNYAFITDTEGNVTQVSTLKGPYVFAGPGTFTLPMTSPTAYWLMERLFVAI